MNERDTTKEVSTHNYAKTIALVAHDNRKKDLVEWVEWNFKLLAHYKMICTGTTGKLVEDVLQKRLKKMNSKGGKIPEISIEKLRSGPLGGDQQLGALIVEGKVDVMIFFWDPMEPHPHDVDVKALLRIAVVYNIPIACNRSSADFMISSPLMKQEYHPIPADFTKYLTRKVPGQTPR